MYGVILLTMLEGVAQTPVLDPVLLWNDETLQAIRTARTPPPVAARNLAMVHCAIFDAVNAVTRTHRRYLVDVVPPSGTSAEVAATVAAHRVLIHLYPAQAKRFNATLDRALALLPRGRAREEGITLGYFVAQQMIAWRASDGSDRKVTYRQGAGPGVWKPTLPAYAEPSLPQWPGVNTFGVTHLDRYRPVPPPRLNSAAYTAAHLEVQALGAVDSRYRTPDQTQIALFWADNLGTVTPPGHWNVIALRVAMQQRLTMVENARLFALLNMALADAAISCWDGKYLYNFWRPITAIREADTANNPNLRSDPAWKPLIDTPPFPSYASGHSTFSGAGATVLRIFFGTDRIRFSSPSDELPGVIRSYNGFWEAAEEAGMSRIYGGIHYSFDNKEGLRTGDKIAQFITGHYMTPRQPSLPVQRETLRP